MIISAIDGSWFNPKNSWLSCDSTFCQDFLCSCIEITVQQSLFHSVSSVFISESFSLAWWNEIFLQVTSNWAVGRPGRDGCSSLIKQDVTRLLAHIVFRNGMNVTVVEAIPLAINGVLTVSCKPQRRKMFYTKWSHWSHRCGPAAPTCVVPPLHGAVMVAHGVQVVQVVLRVPAHAVGPSPRRPVGRETPAALAPLHHVWRHVHACERELHHVLHLHAPISILTDTNVNNNFKQLPVLNASQHRVHIFIDSDVLVGRPDRSERHIWSCLDSR